MMVTGSTETTHLGYRIFHIVMTLVVVAAVGVAAVAIGAGVWQRFHPDVPLGAVRLVSNGAQASGASSLLTRDDDGIDYDMHVARLPSGHVMTLRAEIFNHPDKCTHGSKPLYCGQADLTDPGVEGSVVFLASNYLRGTTAATFTGRLNAGDASHAISGGGLTNPRGAAVHLIVMDHGEALPGTYRDQLSTVGAGCAHPPAGGDTPGPIECVDLLYSAYE
jgi:hypothetical protein